MVNFKKIDGKDFIFVSKSISAKEEKEFSEFLKNVKTKNRIKKAPVVRKRLIKAQ